MKNFDNKYFYWGITVLIVMAIGITFYFLLLRWDTIINNVFKFIQVFTPFLCGFIIAYLLSPIIKFLEKYLFDGLGNKIFKTEKNAKNFSRISSIIISTVILFGLIIGFFSFIIPEILRSFEMIITNVPIYLNNCRNWLQSSFDNKPELKELIMNNYDSISKYVNGYISSDSISSFSSILDNISMGIVNILKAFYNIVIGYIIAIYFLLGKEQFLAQGKKLLYTIIKPDKAYIIIDNLRYTHRIFGGFLLAKVIDSLIIGLIGFVFMILLDMPYSLLLAVIIGVTNIIPYFGPIIGAVPCLFLILLVDPSKFLTFLIFIIILQQFDGNILGPKILGNKTGLQSFWVLFAIIVFGGLFGFMGMLLGVPLFSILYSFFNGVCSRRLAVCNLPLDSVDYQNINYIDPVTNEPVYYEKKIKKEKVKKEKKKDEKN